MSGITNALADRCAEATAADDALNRRVSNILQAALTSTERLMREHSRQIELVVLRNSREANK